MESSCNLQLTVLKTSLLWITQTSVPILPYLNPFLFLSHLFNKILINPKLKKKSKWNWNELMENRNSSSKTNNQAKNNLDKRINTKSISPSPSVCLGAKYWEIEAPYQYFVLYTNIDKLSACITDWSFKWKWALQFYFFFLLLVPKTWRT